MTEIITAYMAECLPLSDVKLVQGPKIEINTNNVSGKADPAARAPKRYYGKGIAPSRGLPRSDRPFFDPKPPTQNSERGGCDTFEGSIDHHQELTSLGG
jgi:hypothetical protein